MSGMGRAGGMLKEMLYVLDAAMNQGTEMDQRVAYQLALAVLADDTDEGLLRMMHVAVKSFVPNKQPRSHLEDTVEVEHPLYTSGGHLYTSLF
jgi:hypothetical protein